MIVIATAFITATLVEYLSPMFGIGQTLRCLVDTILLRWIDTFFVRRHR
jgi:hypothetical protein